MSTPQPAGSESLGPSPGPESIIEPDSADSELDSDVSSTRSVRESIFEFIRENGRAYHSYAAGSYNFPHDEPELERLDLQYEIMKVFFKGRSHFAPLTNPRKALDVGTGTGKWCLDFAKEFPRCEVTGTDLSPVQGEGDIPSNVRFIIDDASEPDWGIRPASLDYIHTRVMLGSFEDFSEVIRKAFFYLKPGGWMESQEYHQTLYCDDGTMPPDFPLKEWSDLQNHASLNLGRPLRIGNKLKRWYERAGFVDIHEDVYKQPVNTWPRDPQMKMIGRFSELSLLDGLQAFSLGWFHRGLGWTKDEIEVFMVPVRKAISDRSVHGYHKIFVVWAQKPFTSTTTSHPSSYQSFQPPSNPPERS